MGNVLGIHRPYFEKEYFEGLSAAQAQEKYNSMSNDVKVYLKEMEIPNNVIEKMFEISSTEIFYLNFTTTRAMEKVPFFDEWIKPRCETLSDEERNDFGTLENKFNKGELSNPEKSYLKLLEEKNQKYLECYIEKLKTAQYQKKK